MLKDFVQLYISEGSNEGTPEPEVGSLLQAIDPNELTETEEDLSDKDKGADAVKPWQFL